MIQQERAQRLNRVEAAHRIREHHGVPCEPSTLSKHAHFGTGPAYVLIGGRSYYEPAAVDAWARSLISGTIRRAADARAASEEVAA